MGEIFGCFGLVETSLRQTLRIDNHRSHKPIYRSIHDASGECGEAQGYVVAALLLVELSAPA